MPNTEDELDSFLNHRTRDNTSGFLKGWKKDPGHITVFLHRKYMPKAVWQHPIPKVTIMEDKNDKSIQVKRVFGGDFVCWEAEDLLKAQYDRDNDGNRTKPPQRCGVCRFVEWVYDAVSSKQIRWTDVLLRFDADDPKETRILRAGGIYGAFGRKDLTADEKSQMREASISPRDAFRDNLYAKGKYIFFVVNADKPGDGVLSTVETSLLGDKVKDVIRDTQDSLGADKGNPFKNPYAIKWEYDDTPQIAFNKMYRARRIERVPLTEQIDKFISGERPDDSNLTERFNADTVRSMLERACVPALRKVVPWDQLFGPPARQEGSDHPDLPAQRPGVDVQGPAPQQPVDDDPYNPDEQVECSGDGCKRVLKMSDLQCPKCGKSYPPHPKDPRSQPPPQQQPTIRKRGDAAKPPF
jgi:hypothetical protein